MYHIVLCFDYHYQSYWRHVVNSVKENTKEECQFYFICDNTVSERNIAEYKNYGINVINFKSRIDIVPNGSIKSIAQYYRIFIPELIQVDKVLYLDNDVIVNADIKELFEIDLTDYYCACVRDPLNYGMRDTQNFQGFVTGTQYNLNNPTYLTGQMVINCKLWRQDNLTEKLIEFISKQKTCDMLAINCICLDKIKQIGYEWSMPVGYFTENGILLEDKLRGIDYTNSKLLHSHGIRKFWNGRIYGSNLYEKYSK